MVKKLLAVLIVLMLAFSSVPALAAANSTNDEFSINTNDKKVIYKDTITVTSEGGRYEIGFVTLDFPKNFIQPDKLPITFKVEISALDGVPGIEIKPDSSDFQKAVKIKVDSYKGLLYDRATGENIEVVVKKQVIRVKHFSRYAFS